MAACIGTVLDGTAGPRSDRHADLLGEELGLDLVAEQTHRVGGRADEGDVQPGAHVGESGVLGDEAPTDPHRVGLRFGQRALELDVVEVRGCGCRGRPKGDTLVGLTHEHGPSLGLGVQRDRRDVVVVLGVQLPDCPDEAYGRLTPIDHCDPFEHARCHRSPWFVRSTALVEAQPR